MSLINYDHPVEHVRKYPDNRAEYMARALATCSITQKKIGAQYSIEGGIDEIGSVKTVKLLSKLLKDLAPYQEVGLRFKQLSRGSFLNLVFRGELLNP